MYDYTTSRALQDEKLRQATDSSHRSERALPSWLQPVYQAVNSMLSPHNKATLRRVRKEGTA